MSDFFLTPPQWLSGGADRDVVVSVRVRFVRNLEGYTFPWRSPREEVRAARDRMSAAIAESSAAAPVFLKNLEDCDSLEGAALRERGLLGGGDNEFEGRAVAVPPGGLESFVINGVDHLRIVSWGAGSDLDPVFARARERELLLDDLLSFSFSSDFGYLAARPEDCGAALRISALVFLPGILAAGVFDRFSRSLLTSGVEPRLRHLDTEGAGSGTPSPFVELSARAPLGCSEEEAVQRFDTTLRGVIEGERLTRSHVFERERSVIEDRTLRAAAILRASRRLSSDETPRLFARLREGLVYGVVRRPPGEDRPQEDPYQVVDATRLLVSTAHARLYARSRRIPASADADEVRSALVREALPRYHI